MINIETAFFFEGCSEAPLLQKTRSSQIELDCGLLSHSGIDDRGVRVMVSLVGPVRVER